MNDFNIEWNFLLNSLYKFLITIVCTTILSIERESHSHPGGVVTHILVSLGSCLYTIISINFSNDADPSRVAAQIVSGMGFLGSATVFKSDKYVKGINTAANLWLAAGLGMAIGMGLWEISLIISIFVAVILYVSNKCYKIRRKKKKIKEKKRQKIKQEKELELQNQSNLDIQVVIQKEIDDINEEIEDENDEYDMGI